MRRISRPLRNDLPISDGPIISPSNKTFALLGGAFWPLKLWPIVSPPNSTFALPGGSLSAPCGVLVARLHSPTIGEWRG